MTIIEISAIVFVLMFIVFSSWIVRIIAADNDVISIVYVTVDSNVILAAERYHGVPVRVELVDGETHYYGERNGRRFDIFTDGFNLQFTNSEGLR